MPFHPFWQLTASVALFISTLTAIYFLNILKDHIKNSPTFGPINALLKFNLGIYATGTIRNIHYILLMIPVQYFHEIQATHQVRS